MNDLSYLIEILERSVERNGEQPLTNRWLLNICKVAKEKSEVDMIPSWEFTSLDDIG